ncbi:cobaltochelatase subunit CobN [Dietzia sp.]|uniref:cobaltochelatase subunit CobN n=1 Tax=Dietzia sp. TaxID=1871616 RepID=UPI002FD9EE8A
MPILLLSTSDTDLLSAHASGADFVVGNPMTLSPEQAAERAADCPVAVLRYLGSRQSIEDHAEAIVGAGAQLVVVSGEQAPDADLMGLSTVPAGVAREAHDYLAHGGAANLANLHAFLSDTILLSGDAFAAPEEMPEWGYLSGYESGAFSPASDGLAAEIAPSAPAPRVAVVYYRAQHLAGNTAYVEALCDGLAGAGAQPVPVFAASLRRPAEGLLDVLRGVDVAIVTVLAAGGSAPALAGAGESDESWNVAHLAELDIPILQGLCLTSSRAAWLESDDGLTPLDVATQVAVPEFDGRVITVPFSFKEYGDDGLARYVPDTERVDRLSGLATRQGVLRTVPPQDKRVVLMLSAYPTKHARIGNAVGLDTGASVVEILRAMRDTGYDLGAEPVPGLDTAQSDDLIHAIIAAGGQDPDWLTEEQMASSPHRIPADTYREWFATMPEGLRADVVDAWGEAPGELYVHDNTIYVAALEFGNVLVMVQPPRGFGENPVAIYHDPDLAPSHHYLAAYRWLREPAARGGFGAHIVCHVGKHGNMEWLPGKNVGLSADCGPDAAIGDLPLVYPFLVNDPGEGSQAKRRAHAVLIDHLIPPMARAESYGDVNRLEQLLDEHASVAAMDPAKLPALRQQIWTLITAARMDRELGWEQRPDEEVFDDMLMHVDGWLCEIKDVQIRDGLHTLGRAPEGTELIELVTAMLRARRMWGGDRSADGLREALGLAEDGSETRSRTDEAERLAAELVGALADADWSAASVPGIVAAADLPADARPEAVSELLDFTAREIVPRLRATADEIPRILHALAGGFIPAGPSGSPLRGLVNVLPTGRNFYSVDPRALPSPLAWETGTLMADSLLRRHLDDDGEYPRTVGLSVWGTSAMRTSGDDIAEVFALLGVRPRWDEGSRRIVGLELMSTEELGRPRIDVTVRISGFFRDAFPHVLALIDDAVRMAATADEPDAENYLRANVEADTAAGVDPERAADRIFGSKPGTYGAGILQTIDSGNWRDESDLAAVYTEWGGYSYGRGRDGAWAGEDMQRVYSRIEVAAKNVDSLEHDVLDSDDYYQFHGGMVATVKALSGTAPAAYVGDSTRPDSVRTRSLLEETSRVIRARVLNPRWIAGMRKHGYKGAFEMAATVDYLFGFDATTQVVDDWTYEAVGRGYVLDPENRAFLEKSNPWAMHSMAERLLEAADRGLWSEPDPELLDSLREAFLDAEGRIEGGE